MVQPQCPGISAPRVHAPGGAPQDGHAFSKYKSAFGHQRFKAYTTFNRSQTDVSRLLAEERSRHYRQFASNFKVELPPQSQSVPTNLDLERIRADSTLARRCHLSQEQFVRVYRCQTPDDPRPNKELFELEPPTDPRLRALTQQWNEVVREGVKPLWNDQRPTVQRDRPPNHRSIGAYMNQIRQHIVKGHRDGRYLVVEADLLDQWTNIFISPLGVADKAGSPLDIRVINDYSYPSGSAVNDCTDRSNFPAISYNPPRDIARRIWELRVRFPGHPILMMLGDVSGAIRHIPVSAEHVHMFAFKFDNLLVIDLSCGFGWCGSPAFYSLAATLINQLYEDQRPLAAPSPLDASSFTGNAWCDDHTCVEIDTGTRCMEANLALRRAMATVLGPHALNEDKFTPWSTNIKALGLLWDTVSGTVSIPADKIIKARTRMSETCCSRACSLSTLNKLIGSLRYVTTCFPAARAFYQNVQTFAATFRHSNERRTIPSDVREDLSWFAAVLTHANQLNSIPVEHFARLQPPTRHVFMDASDTGLCALEPQLKQFLRVQFTQDVRDGFGASKQDNSINVRELLSAVLAILHWGPAWASTGRDRTHICMWIDNTSAVSWLSKRSSRHPIARMYNRLISLSEFRYSLTCSARHIPGDENTMADAGSRAWGPYHTLYDLWTNLSYSWTQVPIRSPFDNLSKTWETYSADMPSLHQPPGSTTPTGVNGASSPRDSAGLHGSHAQGGQVTRSSAASLSTVGGTGGTASIEATHLEQSS